MNKNIIMESNNYPHVCMCCGEGEIKEQHDVCLICGWEDDEVQNFNPDFAGGANKKSMKEHKKAFELQRSKNKNYQWCNTWK